MAQRRTFTTKDPAMVGSASLWFHVDIDDGRIVGLEEHNQYQGGPLKLHEGTWEDLFLARVEARQPLALEAAKVFLAEL